MTRRVIPLFLIALFAAVIIGRAQKTFERKDKTTPEKGTDSSLLPPVASLEAFSSSDISTDSLARYFSPRFLRIAEVASAPALHLYFRKPAEGTLTLLGDLANHSIKDTPTGKNHLNLGVEASGLVLLPQGKKISHLVWGSVSYRYCTTKGQLWNESNQFERVAPYVMGDPIGGTLSASVYSFDGGYTMLLTPRFSLGMGIAFDGEVTYRRKDPRPKNISTNLLFLPSISYRMGERHLIALSAILGRYKQSNDLAFYSLVGNTPLYHLGGVGTVHPRFSGLQKSAFYRGNDYGATLTWVKLHGSASEVSSFSPVVSLTFKQEGTEKILGDINNSPISSTADYTLEASAALDCRLQELAIQPFLSYSSATRYGRETILGDPSQGEYPVLGYITPYKSQLYRFEGGLTVEAPFTKRHRWFAQVDYKGYLSRQRYILEGYAGNRELGHHTFTASGGLQLHYGRKIFSAKLAAGYRPEGTAFLKFPDNAKNEALKAFETAFLHYEALSRIFTSTDIEARFALSKGFSWGVRLAYTIHLSNQEASYQYGTASATLYF